MLADILKDAGFWSWLGPAGATLIVVALILRWLLPRLRRFGHFLDDVRGEPERPGVPRRPGLVENVAALRDHVAHIDGRLTHVETDTSELRRNNGDSARDQLDELTASNVRLDQRLAVVERHTRPCEEK